MNPQEWVQQLGHEGSQTLLTIAGSSSERAVIYNSVVSREVVVDRSYHCRQWSTNSLSDNLYSRLSLPSIIAPLTLVPDLTISEDLLNVIDKGYSPRLSEAFAQIWEMRLHGTDTLQDLADWSANLKHQHERFDLLLFWLTLTAQNGYLSKVVFPFDNFGAVYQLGISERRELFQELVDLIACTQRWAPFGSPLGLMVGMTPETQAMLEGSLGEQLLSSVHPSGS